MTFFLNSVNWLVGDIPLANIRPKVIAQRLLVLTANEYEIHEVLGLAAHAGANGPGRVGSCGGEGGDPTSSDRE